MIVNERDQRREQVIAGARQMMTAARTAPKAKGLDIIEVAMIAGDDIRHLSDAMIPVSEETGLKFLLRDADNILQADALLLIGTKSQPLGMNCAYCGFNTCEMKPEQTPCAINSIDVGIAVGSACATAADLRLDTRVMFSVGMVARRLNMLDDCHQIIAIAVSASSKNPFFDRKPKEIQK